MKNNIHATAEKQAVKTVETAAGSGSGPASLEPHQAETSIKAQETGLAAAAPGGCPAAGPVPCLLDTSAPNQEKSALHGEDQLLGLRSAIARKADTLRQNLQDLIERNGVERVGFVTLTFKENLCAREVAEKRFHSFATHILPQIIDEYISVPERQQRGAIHYHLAAAFKFDIRTGFDVVACLEANQVKKHGYLGAGKWLPGYQERFKALERQYLASANPALKRVWRIISQANERIAVLNRKPGRQALAPSFGRCQTLPVLSNADAIAFYVGTYITSATERRAPEDRGMRTVRYSLVERLVHQSFHFRGGGNGKWRTGCKILAKLLLLTDEVEGMRDGKKLVYLYPPNHPYSRFGRGWAYRLAPWVKACQDDQTVCLNFAASLSPELTWPERLVAVGQFMDRLTGKPSTRMANRAKGGRHA